MTYLGSQFAPARDDIQTIRLWKIVWDIHSDQDGIVHLKRRLQALGSPVEIVAISTPVTHVTYQMVLPTHNGLENGSGNEIGRRVLAFTTGLKGLIVRTERGFDFLGYHFSPEGLTIAQKTLDNFVERAIRLYEQGPGEPCGSTRLGEYVKRWVRWAGPPR